MKLIVRHGATAICDVDGIFRRGWAPFGISRETTAAIGARAGRRLDAPRSGSGVNPPASRVVA